MATLFAPPATPLANGTKNPSTSQTFSTDFIGPHLAGRDIVDTSAAP
jgi:hypothetical protein